MKFFLNYNNFQQIRRMSSHNVFVYGTLKKGEPNHHWLQAANNGISKFISKGKTTKKYPLVIASKYNIPFLLHDAGKGKHVVGEIYEIDDQMLSNLDKLEDHPSFYEREVDQVQLINQNGETESDNTVNCWIYFLKKFKPFLLNEEFYAEYNSEGNHSKPYTPSSKRIPGYHAKLDVLQL